MAYNGYSLVDEVFAALSKKYPDIKRSDIEEVFAQEIFANTAYRAQRSEIELLKNKVIGAMGTDKEMRFSDIESGMLKASLADGRQALKEIIDEIPVEAPQCRDGTPMKNQGSKKKNIMTTLGLVEGVGRTLYRDDVELESIYPLDEKIGLIEIGGRYSRYTSNFGHLSAELYARMPERDALAMLKKTLDIDLEKDSLTAIGEAVAQAYLPPRYDEDAAVEQTVVRELGFVEKLIQEIDESADRDAIIGEALKGNVYGYERKPNESDRSAAYILSDGIGVSGLPKELSDQGKNGGPAKTFEVKVGAYFTQSFDSNGLPLLANGSIYRNSESARYIGTVERIGQFTPQMAEFARTNGAYGADQIVFLSDGAHWLEGLRQRLFPNSIGIVDFYHASQHLYKLIESLQLCYAQEKASFTRKCYSLLEAGDIDKMADLIGQKTTDVNRESVNKQLAYFTGNKDKMRYGLFRAAGLFIGSGVIEAGCKIIAENRLNGSGMRWTKKNAANVIALRCAIYSGFYDVDAA